MDKFRLTECQTLDIPVGNDMPLLVKLVKGFDGCDGEGAVPFPIDVCENVVVAMVSERGQVKSVAHRLGTDGEVLLELQAGDFRAGLTYGIDVRATLNGKAVHAYGKSLVRITAATERGPRQVAQAADPYEVTMFVGYIGSVIPSRLADLADDSEHRTVTDAEKNRWNNPPLPDLRDYATKEFARAVAQAEAVPMTLIDYHQLKYLRDSFSLIPGRQYRIIDYVATTTQENTRSAGRGFDIIVTATGPAKLSEWARAARRGDYCYMCDSCDYCSCDSCDADWADYCRMESWLLLYCLDNDTSRFAWADDSSNGRGVVYWMRDEWGNEMPFDFKGIQFYALNTQWQVNPGGADVYYYYYYYAFSNQVGGTVQSRLEADIYDASLDGTARRNVVKPCFEDGVQVLNSVLYVNLDELCGSTIPFGEITENFVDFNCRDLMACTILYESWSPIGTYSRNIEVNKGFRNPRENFILRSDTRYGYPDQEDKNTTYKLSKSGSTITLTGSDGSSTSVVLGDDLGEGAEGND